MQKLGEKLNQIADKFLAKCEKLAAKETTYFVFPPHHPKVTDGQGHYPIGSVEQAKLALKRVEKEKFSPIWFSGTLKELKSTVEKVVKSKFPEALDSGYQYPYY